MKPSQPNLDRLLQDARTIGTLDSEGAFTIAGDAAIGKLAAFQLPRKSAWILKIIQAAVASGSKRLDIKQGQETTTFTFEPGHDLDLIELKKTLTSPQVSHLSVTENLAVGLRAVGFGDKRSFTLVLESHGRRTVLAWDGSKLMESVESVKEATPASLHLQVWFPAEDQGRRLTGLAESAGRASTEYLEVVTNGEVCPIPLLFDGRRLDQIAAPATEKTEGSTVPLSLGWSPLPDSQQSATMGLPQSLIENARRKKLTDKFTDDRTFHLDGIFDHTAISSMAKIQYSFRIVHYGSQFRDFEFRPIDRRSEYLWVKHGVICHREQSQLPASAVSFQVYLPADDLPTDVSGLSIKSTEKSERRKQAARIRLRFQAQNTLTALEAHTPGPFTRDAIIGSGFSTLCLIGVPLTLGKSLLASSIGVAILRSSADNKKWLKGDCTCRLSRLCAQLESSEPG